MTRRFLARGAVMSSYNSYDVGDSIRLIGTFTNSSGTLTDPTALTLILSAGTCGTTQYTYAQGSITRAAAGSYYRDLLPIPGTPGFWTYRWEATGNVIAAAETQFFVRTPEV